MSTTTINADAGRRVALAQVRVPENVRALDAEHVKALASERLGLHIRRCSESTHPPLVAAALAETEAVKARLNATIQPSIIRRVSKWWMHLDQAVTASSTTMTRGQALLALAALARAARGGCVGQAARSDGSGATDGQGISAG